MEHNILIDTSGSMAEEGRPAVLRYLLRAAADILHSEMPDLTYHAYHWGMTVSEADGKLTFGGSSDDRALADWLRVHADSRILLMTDGSFSERAGSVLRAKKAAFIVVSVGAGCDRTKMKKTFGIESVYEAADIAAALTAWCTAGSEVG